MKIKSLFKKIKKKLRIVIRNFLEFFKIGILSKPYIYHTDLYKHINKKNGFYIVGGGNDGYTQDPTYFLEKIRGWKGIIVEPLPIYEVCQKNRPNSKVMNSALVSEKTTEKITMINCNLMSTVKNSELSNKTRMELGEKIQNIKSEEIEVNTTTLNEVFAESQKITKQIDLLVLDIEGYEIEALKGLDFDTYSPQFILIEILNKNYKSQIESILKNYALVTNLGDSDFLYKIK